MPLAKLQVRHSSKKTVSEAGTELRTSAAEGGASPVVVELAAAVKASVEAPTAAALAELETIHLRALELC